MQLRENYGELKKNVEYLVLETGYDWVRIRCHGTSFYIPVTLLRDD